MALAEKRPRQKKELRRHVSLMRQVAQQVVDQRDPREARPAPSPPWWSTVFSSRYKTEMCHHLDELGYCNFGAGCVYAHSAAELRPLKRHPKHRSQLCKDFHEEGFCSFGARCSFIHTRQDVADIVEQVIQRTRSGSLPMPENPSSAASAATPSSSVPSARADLDETLQSSQTDSAKREATGDGTPPSKKRKRRSLGKKGASLDPRFNHGPWKREDSDLPPLCLEPSLLEAPLEEGFRRKWDHRWKEMPFRRLEFFQQLCPCIT